MPEESRTPTDAQILGATIRARIDLAQQHAWYCNAPSKCAESAQATIDILQVVDMYLSNAVEETAEEADRG